VKAGELPMGEFADVLTHPKVMGTANTASAFFASVGDGKPTADKPLHALLGATTVLGNLNHLYRYQRRFSRQRMVPGKINERWDKLVHDWALHLLACAQGISLTTLVYGQDTVAEFAPIAKEEAQQWLMAIVTALQAALVEPLPVA